MNPYALGWDNHRKFSKVSLMEQTPEGEIRAVERARLEHSDKQAMRAWLSHLDAEIPVALEATFGWPWVVWSKRVPYSDTPLPRPGSRPRRPEPQESPMAKTTLRSDQPRHPMVRRRETVGQTRS